MKRWMRVGELEERRSVVASVVSPIFVIVVLGLFVGCVPITRGTGPIFSKSPAPTDKVVVYHYRLEVFAGSAFSYLVAAKGKVLARVGNGGYFRHEVEPGLIRYVSKLKSDHGTVSYGNSDYYANRASEFVLAFRLDAPTPRTVFLRWTADPFRTLPRVEEVPESVAMQEIMLLQAFEPDSPTERTDR